MPVCCRGLAANSLDICWRLTHADDGDDDDDDDACDAEYGGGISSSGVSWRVWDGISLLSASFLHQLVLQYKGF